MCLRGDCIFLGLEMECLIWVSEDDYDQVFWLMDVCRYF